MIAPLERHYRRLLAVYPAAHRRAYEEEMVGVLMAGAGSDQRRPAPGEILDLLRAGLAARLGCVVRGLRTSAWRDAAAVAALTGVVLLVAVPGRRLLLGWHYMRESGDPMRAAEVDGGLLIDVAARSLAWLAVLIALLLAARRSAVALGVVAILVEVAAVGVWSPSQEFRAVEKSWALALALLTVGLLVASRHSRPAVTILGRRGSALVTAGLLLLAASSVVPGPLPLLAAGALLVPGLQSIQAGTRGRTLVLLASVAAVPVAQQVLEKAIGIAAAPAVTPGIVVTDVLVMAGLPLTVFAVAALALHLRENVTVSLTLSRKEAA